VSVALNYFRLTIAGEEVVEVDAKNLVRKVGGVDQMAKIRNAIGL
jgi:P2 family phage contractile tail tube protein